MASRSESPEIIETLTTLGKRKRTSPDRDIKAEPIEDNLSELDDRLSSDDQLELDGLDDEDIDEDAEEIDHEPEQGKVLWSEEQESYPHCAPYHPDIEKIGENITEIFDAIVKFLTTISNKSEGMKRLSMQASDIRRFPEPKVPIIALMGDAGAGKSSLISAILDTPFVSREGNFGKSCTCVITEYRKSFPQQTRKFGAKVEFLSTEQRHLLLKEHLEHYIDFHFEDDSDWTYEEKREFSLQAKTAQGTFMDLFRGKQSFRTHEELEDYLRIAYLNDKTDAVIAQFEKWCEELTSEHDLCTQSALIEADRAFELNKILTPFLSSSAVWIDKPSLWPIVHKVSIGVQGPRVLQNAIFADLPGVSDVNMVRARAGRTYLLLSDHLWIVSPIGRTVTDTSVDSLLYEYGNRFLCRLAIVCTKIDDPMTFQSFAQEYQEEAEPCKKIEAHTKKAKANFSNAKARLRGARAAATVMARRKEVDRCRVRYQVALHRRLETMVQIRNRKVTSLLYAEKSDRLKKGEVDIIHCVSNKHYSWLKGYKEEGQEEAPQLSGSMTGIPKLRQYALTIPSQEIWSTFTNHIKHTSTAFIKALRIWATRTNEDNSNGLADVRGTTARTIRAALQTYQETLKRETLELLAEPMSYVYDEMAQKATDYFKEVREWRWMTIKAFIRRSGTYNSKAVGSASWNAKMMLPAARIMKSGWDKMILKEQEALDIANKTILGVLDTILAEVKEPMEVLQIPLGHFQGFLQAQRHGVIHAFANYKEELDKQLKIVEFKIEKDDNSGYFANAMEPVYESARDIKGKGYKNTVLEMITTHVNKKGKKSPFVKMAKSAARDFHERAVDNCLNDLQDACLKIFDEIFLQFGCLIDNIPDEDGSVAATKHSLRDFLVEADNEMESMVKRLDEIEKDPRPPIVEAVQDPVQIKKEPEDRVESPATEDTPQKKMIKLEIKDEED